MSRNLQDNPFHGVIKDYQHWVVLFREKQVTIGSVIIMAKDTDKQSLGSLSAEAWSEFGTVTHDVEAMLVAAFGAEKFNYLALMMYDPEVHFHVIPRYSSPVRFAGKTFIDVDWPEATKRVALSLDDEVLRTIEQELIRQIAKL